MGKKSNASDMSRIVAKVRSDDDSYTKTYVTSAVLSVHQTHIARKPRPDPLQILVLEIMNKRPRITPSELLHELRRREGGPVIEEITDKEIFFIEADGRGGNAARISGLKDRMSRARKALESSR